LVGLWAITGRMRLQRCILACKRVGWRTGSLGLGGVVAKEAFSITGQTILVKDDYPAVYFNGCLDGDSLTMMYNGYSMTKAT